MKLTYLAHACFLLEANGKKVVFDPYKWRAFEGAVGYDRVNVSADVVLLSHHHDDHAGVEEVRGDFQVFDTPGEYEVDGLKIKGIASHHDPEGGRLRGSNVVFVVSDGSRSVAHLGDQGWVDPKLIRELAQVDVVLLPIGGTYTIGPREAMEFVRQLPVPKVFVPMHYKTPKLGFPIKTLDDFLSLVEGIEVVRAGKSELDLSSLAISGKRIVVLEMAR